MLRRSDDIRRGARQKIHIPHTMLAAVIDHYGGPEVLAIHALPVAPVGPRDVLIALDTAGVRTVGTILKAASTPSTSWCLPTKSRACRGASTSNIQCHSHDGADRFTRDRRSPEGKARRDRDRSWRLGRRRYPCYSIHQALPCESLVTASGIDGPQLVRETGAVLVVDGRHEDIAEAVRRCAPDGIDAVLALAGGDILENCGRGRARSDH